MKYLLYILIFFLFIGVVYIGVIYSKKHSMGLDPVAACTMDAKICPDGSAVGRTGPNCEFAPCPTILNEEAPALNPHIIIDTLTAGASITSPVTITGKARGNWFFEGSFPITIVNWDGLIIGEGYAKAQGDWMTEAYVPFVAEVTYTLSPETPYPRGTIILKQDNPSGLPEHDATLEVGVQFGESI